MLTHDATQADSLDRIPAIAAQASRDPQLILLTTALLRCVDIAAAPGTTAPVYRPATSDAVRLARQAYRTVIALDGREQMRLLMAQAARQPRRFRRVRARSGRQLRGRGLRRQWQDLAAGRAHVASLA